MLATLPRSRLWAHKNRHALASPSPRGEKARGKVLCIDAVSTAWGDVFYNCWSEFAFGSLCTSGQRHFRRQRTRKVSERYLGSCLGREGDRSDRGTRHTRLGVWLVARIRCHNV